MIVQPFGFLKGPEAGGGGGLPPVGSYITTGLTYYYDFGEPTSYPGTGTTVTNLAPAATKRGDATIYQGTMDTGTVSTAGTTYDATTGTLKLGGTAGTFDQYFGDQNWFGDTTNYNSGNWSADFTFEIGFYYYPHGYTGLSAQAVYAGQRVGSTGAFGNGDYQFTIFRVADYFWPNGVQTQTSGQAYILTTVFSGTSAKRYINGVLEDSTTMSSTRKYANSPFAWGLLYTKETGNDRMLNPTWSAYQYCRFYESTALSATDVATNYAANKARLGLS